MRLPPEASREVIAELNRPAADTPERRRTFERVAALQDRLDFRASQVVSGRASRKYMASLRKESKWRRFLWFISASAALLAIFACASVPTEDSYPIAVYIQNHEGRPAIAPRFYLLGVGRHPLGTVQGNDNGTSSIDSRWIPPDGQLIAVVSYVGSPELVSEPFTWHPGEYIDIQLNQSGEIVHAWSHR